MVILTVLIRHLYARFGQPVDIVSSGSWARPLLEGQPGVGEIFIVGSRKRPYLLSWQQQRLVARLRERGPSATWLCDYEHEKPRWLLERAGWQPQHWCVVHGLTGVPGPHMSDLYLRFAYCNPSIIAPAHSPLVATDAYSHLRVADGHRENLKDWLRVRGWNDRAFILVQPGNKRTMRRGLRSRTSNSKYWPEAKWAGTLQCLRRRYPKELILLCGVSTEVSLNNEILELSAIDNAFNIAADLPLPRLMALAERAQGMISVDTGPAHVAAAVGCPVVTLFGKALPERYEPRGNGARLKSLTGFREGEQTMLGISCDEVLSALEEVRGA